jgi:hypothetical protein
MKRLGLVLFLVACGGDDGGEAPPCDPTIPGDICTIAGDGKNGYAGDDGPATAARMSLPQDTLVAPDGSVLVLDWNNHRLRRIDPDGTMRHVAGRGELGGTLDDPANSDLNHPTSMVLSADGTKVIVAAWHNSQLRSVDLATGELVTLAGDGRRAYFGDAGAATTSSLDLPASLAWLPDGKLAIMDQANQVIRAIDGDGTITRIAGRCVVDAAPPLGGGPCADGVEPTACPAPSGKFTCSNMATCMAPCTPSYGGDTETAMTMRMSQPLLVLPDGSILFADTGNSIIRKIAVDGTVTRIAGKAPIDGVAQAGFSGDGGPAVDAQLSNPVDLAVHADTIYVTDVYNHCVRAIDAAGTISTVAGVCGQPGYSGDGGPANVALLKRPYGLDIHAGVLYISDTGNNAIRQVLLP